MTKEVREKAVKAIRAAFKSGRADIESIGRHSRERWKNEAYKNKTIMARKKYNLEQIFIITHNSIFDDYPLNLILFKGAEVNTTNKNILFEY